MASELAFKAKPMCLKTRIILSRGPQLHFGKKTKNWSNFIKFIDFPPFPLFGVGQIFSFLSARVL